MTKMICDDTDAELRRLRLQRTMKDVQNERDYRNIAINKVGKGQLEQLPSIGPVKAQRIVDYRNKKGVFEDYEAITEVNGIGEKTLETIRPLITLQE